MTELATEVLTDAIASAEQSVSVKRAEHAVLAQEIERLEHELVLLRELRSIREGTNESAPERPPRPVAGTTLVPGSDTLTAAVVEILNSNGRPMHIQDLAAALRERGVRIPGKGANANLISHIRACAEIVRPVRGMYAMRSWGFVDRELVASPRRRKAAERGGRGTIGVVSRGGVKGERSR